MKWDKERADKEVFAVVNRRLLRAGIETKNHIILKLSKPNSKLVGRGKKGRLVRGRNPSRPGEYPRKLTGHHRRNVALEHSKRKMRVRIGTSVLYGKFLELGTSTMARRPWLSKGLREMRTRISSILQGN